MLAEEMKLSDAIAALEEEIKTKQRALDALKSLTVAGNNFARVPMVNADKTKESPKRQRARRSNSAGLIARRVLVKHGGEMSGDELFNKIVEHGGKIKERSLQTSLNREPGITNVGGNVWKAVDIEKENNET